MDNKGYPVSSAPVMQQAAPVIVPSIMFGPDPMQVTCGQCHKTVMTTTVSENGTCAWIAVLIVCLLCCPCFWIPLTMDSCKDVHHTCPACGAMLGIYKKM